MTIRPTTRNVVILGLFAAAALAVRTLILAPMVHAQTGFVPFELQPHLNREGIIIQLHAATAGIAPGTYLQYASGDIIAILAIAGFVTMLWAWLFARVPNRRFSTFVRRGILLLPAVVAALELAEHAAVLNLIFNHAGLSQKTALVAGLHTAKTVLAQARDILTVAFLLSALFIVLIHKRRQK